MVHRAGLRRLITTVVILATGIGVPSVQADPILQTDVRVDGTLLGTFAIDTYEESSSPVSFGVAIQGGFNPASAHTLPDGYAYRWIQTVTSTSPAHSWQTAGLDYVDRARVPDADGKYTLAQAGSPFYGGGIVGPDGHYQLPFADNPSRELGLDSFQGTWALSLVAVEARTTPGDFNQPDPGATRAIHQLATFVWGFEALKQSDGTMRIDLSRIVELPPDPAALAAAFGRDPDRGTFGNGAWDIRSGLPGSSPGVIPEPSSFLLALSAIVAVGVPLHRTRRRPTA